MNCNWCNRSSIGNIGLCWRHFKQSTIVNSQHEKLPNDIIVKWWNNLITNLSFKTLWTIPFKYKCWGTVWGPIL